MQTEKIQIPFEILDRVTADAKKIQASMDAISKNAKQAGVSESAYRQALAQTKRETEQATEANQKQAMSLTELKSGLDLAKQGFMVVKEALTEVYEIGKEGAQIEFAATRFERLATSIGTTSDVMLQDLRVATKGTLSDMELMASATDLVSLGLAKTQGEATRLATVAAGLGMNMNQLVLTLTNQTTMRFDALGVSVDGFDEKVKKLEETGMSTNDAFKEAFLQQAEEQLQRVGNAADSTYGSYQRLEAQVKTMTDTWKEQGSKALEPLIKNLGDAVQRSNDYENAVKRSGMSYEEFNDAAKEAGMNVNDFTQHILNSETAVDGWVERWNMAHPAIETVQVDMEALTKTNEKYLDTIGNLTSEQDTLHDNLQKIKDDQVKLLDEKQKLIDQGWWKESDAIQNINDKIEENDAKYDEYTIKYEENTKRRILAGIEEQLAVGGLTEEETRYIEELGIRWGVYTQSAVEEAQRARDEINKYVEEFNNIPTSKTVHLDVEVRQFVNSIGVVSGGQSNLPGYASGTDGWQTVPAGYPNDTYPIALSSGESFNVKQAGEGGNSTDFGPVLDALERMPSMITAAMQKAQ